MSPEQIDAKPINLTTDIYSMGILLFEFITGKPPFEGSICSLMTQHNSGVIPSVSSLLSETHLVEEVQIVIQKACAKEPGGRFSSVWEMREALNNILLKSKKDKKKESKLVEKRESNPKESEIQRQDNDVLQSEIEKPLLKGEVKEKKLSASSKLVKSLGAVVVLFLVGLGIYFTQEEEMKVSIPSGKTFKNSIGMEFIEIPSGKFMMGCSEGDSNCEDKEKPQHRVSITKPFYLAKYEVTQGQWKAIMGKNPSNFLKCGQNCPVESVSWNDVQLFIEKLCQKEGINPCRYRLPTEAEWEYAARGSATSSTLYIHGNDSFLLNDYAWYDESSLGTRPVGLKKPNGWGLYDMSGNVSEWVEDWYDISYYYDSPSNDPKGPESGRDRVIRGGSGRGRSLGKSLDNFFASLGSRIEYLRLSRREGHDPNYIESSSSTIGFRLVLDP
jgi:formylglycine-generating enzyme required for sulfatase activity